MATAVEDSMTETVVDLSNYEVLFGMFGNYVRGEVIPSHWLVSKKHHIPTLIATGVIRSTMQPVSLSVEPKLLADAPKTAVDTAPSMQREMDRMKREAEAFSQSNSLLVSQNRELKEQHSIKDKFLGEQTTEIGRLQAVILREKAAREEAEEKLKQLSAKAPSPTPAKK